MRNRNTHILVLEQLGYAKEQCRRFMRAKSLTDIKQVDDARQKRSAFPRRDGRFIEATSFLQDGRLVMVERCYRVSFLSLRIRAESVGSLTHQLRLPLRLS
jgi:hypothetical protein